MRDSKYQVRLYQVEAVKEILDKKRVLIADDMGLGKCSEAISAKSVMDKRNGYQGGTLIISPADVIPHWEREIKKWYKFKENPSVKVIRTKTYEEDVKDARESDFALVGYPTLSRLGDEDSSSRRLAQLEGFHYGVIDEAHNAKNPQSLRSKGVKRILDSTEYLAILTGTPIPNTVIDIYMLLSLLDKEQFPITSENPRAILSSFYHLFKQDPEFVRRVLNDRMMRREIGDYLEGQVPRLNRNSLDVQLEDEHRDVYKQVYENDNIEPDVKLRQLINASVDPNLVSPALLEGRENRIGRMESSVYSCLDDLIERVADSDGKVLIFSDLKEGVTRKLLDRWERYGALLIDGDVGKSNTAKGRAERERLRKQFQGNPDNKVLISTKVMGEGVDLTAATDIVHLTWPYTPADIDQRNRRSQRIGEIEKDELTVHMVRPKIDRNTIVITEGIEQLVDDKRRIVTYIMKQPFSVTKRDLDEIKNGDAHKSKHLSPLIASPSKSLLSHFGQLKGKGGRKIKNHYDKYPIEAEHVANLYSSHWAGYYGGNTANLYKRVIDILSQTQDLGRKIDIASGPFSLSRTLGESVVNLDLNGHMLQAGRLLQEEGEIVEGNPAIKGNFSYLPFAEESFDLALNSLSLHMSSNRTNKDEPMSDRELTLREMNRVLRVGGFGLITLPHSVLTEDDLKMFHPGLESLGFKVMPFSGFYRGPEDSDFRVYLAGLRKEREPQEEELDDELLWKMDMKPTSRTSSSKKKKHVIEEKPPVKPEFVTEFYPTRTRKPLEQVVAEGL